MSFRLALSTPNHSLFSYLNSILQRSLSLLNKMSLTIQVVLIMFKTDVLWSCS